MMMSSHIFSVPLAYQLSINILRVVSNYLKYWKYISLRFLQHISSLDLLLDPSLEPLRS